YRPFALALLEELIGALAAYAIGGLASLVFHAAGGKPGGGARAAPARSLSAGAEAGAEGAAAGAGGPAHPAAAAAAPGVRRRAQEYRAERQLLAAIAAMREADPGAPRALAEALARQAGTASLRAEYMHRVCTGWLQLCSAISLGPRRDGESAMPDANRVGGSG